MSERHEEIPKVKQSALTGIRAGRDVNVGDVTQTVIVEAPLSEREKQERKQRKDLLDDVKSKVDLRWKQSLYNNNQIPLSKVLRPRLVESLVAQDVVRALPEIQEPAAAEMIRIFNEDASRKLLILGRPGAGKTIALLELAKDLLGCAYKSLEEPIPVLLNLSTWKVNSEEMTHWILNQLKSKHGVRRDVGERLLNQRQLVLLLDELDRLSSDDQKVCINGINKLLQQENQPKSIAICSRLEEYEHSGIKFKLEGAVCLQPLTKSQIDEYLLNVIKKPELLKSIEADSDLLEIAEAPLLLSMLILAFEDQKGPIDDKQWQQCKSKDERRQYIFHTFIQNMLDRHIESRFYTNQPPADKTKYWLVQLAKILKTKSSTDFLIENIQPNWWLTDDEQRIYNLVVRLTTGLISGLTAGFYLGGWSHQLIVLLFAVLDGVVIGLLSYIFTLILEPHRSLYFNLASKTLPGLIFFLIAYSLTSSVSLKGWNFLVLLTGIGVGTVFCGLVPKEIKPADKVELSSKKAIQYAGFGLFLGLVFIPIHFAIMPNLYLENSLYWLYELVSFSLVCLLVGLIPGKEVAINLKRYPNQGIWRTRNYAFMWFLTGGIIGGTFTMIMDGPEVIRSIGIALTVGLLASLIGSNCSGLVCIQHFILRLTLCKRGYIPWDYSRFLNYATERKFIQAVGGYYKFWHDSLRKHFAESELTKDTAQ